MDKRIEAYRELAVRERLQGYRQQRRAVLPPRQHAPPPSRQPARGDRRVTR